MSGFHVIASIQERFPRFFFCHSPDASGFGIILSYSQAGSLWRKRKMLDHAYRQAGMNGLKR